MYTKSIVLTIVLAGAVRAATVENVGEGVVVMSLDRGGRVCAAGGTAGRDRV